VNRYVSHLIIFLCISKLSLNVSLLCQSSSDFYFFESRLQTLGDQILNSKNDSSSSIYNNLLIDDIEELILINGSFEFPFKNVNNIKILTSPDKNLKIYNWVLPKNNGEFFYFCYLHFFDKKSKSYTHHKLIDNSFENENFEYQQYTNNLWFGALYSEIVYTNFQGKDFYTLLGWDGNNNFTNKKIIETLIFDEELKPILGVPIIKMKKGNQNRVILEYSENTSINLKFNKELDYIVFDHLEPVENSQDIYEFYFPSLSYDGLTFKNGKWRLVENIPVYNDKMMDGKRLKKIQQGLQE